MSLAVWLGAVRKCSADVVGQDIIIKPADKGSGTVVMDKTCHIDECNRQLNDCKFYKRLNKDITADIQKRVTFSVNRMYHDGLINDKTRQYLIQD